VLFSVTMAIAGAISGRGVLPYRGPPLALGILETQIAFWLLEQPGLTLVAAILAIGLWSMTCGVVQIVLAFEVKSLSLRADTAARDLGMV
jgi:uncharacterized membrane protein HdeD (DUF308 family)